MCETCFLFDKFYIESNDTIDKKRVQEKYRSSPKVLFKYNLTPF